jgi:D-alanyl-D-alanine carboxypeptidase (penicillin-binding protein 5/6)
MTVLLAIEAIESEKVSLYDEVTASSDISYDLIPDGSSANITAGETMTLENLLYCAMVSSANEACNVIAEYIGGSIAAFIDMMNAKAEELGCTGTHFNNTHGLPDEDHYTTAWDFALITRKR